MKMPAMTASAICDVVESPNTICAGNLAQALVVCGSSGRARLGRPLARLGRLVDLDDDRRLDGPSCAGSSGSSGPPASACAAIPTGSGGRR